MTTRNRAAVKRRLIVIAEHAQGGKVDARGRSITVTYAWPGDNSTDSFQYLGDTTGDYEPETIGRAKRIGSDEFTIRMLIQTCGWADGITAEEEAEALLIAFEETLLACDRLRHPDIDDGEPTAYTACSSAHLGTVEGPFHSFSQGDLVIGRVAADVVCRTDLT